MLCYSSGQICSVNQIQGGGVKYAQEFCDEIEASQQEIVGGGAYIFLGILVILVQMLFCTSIFFLDFSFPQICINLRENSFDVVYLCG